MYFGYSEIWRFTFIPVGFVMVMCAFLALCLVYVVGAVRGTEAARRYVNVVAALFVAGSVLDLMVAVLTGQMAAFLRAFGISPLIELAVLSVMCVGSMWFMAVSYVTSKARDEG